MCEKRQILDALRQELLRQRDAITAAARASFATATDDEHKPDSKYDTFSLESSYLARGQAHRAEELTEALDRIKALTLPTLTPRDPVQPGALVEVADEEDDIVYLFLLPAAGGEEQMVEGRRIRVVTPASPMGRALMGRKTGDRVVFRMGETEYPHLILSVR